MVGSASTILRAHRHWVDRAVCAADNVLNSIKEMKATELMIGDWVLTPSKEAEDGEQEGLTLVSPAKVSSLNEFDVIQATCNGGDLYFSPDEVYPIELTPEILEKNGFTHDELEEQATQKWKCKDERPCVMYSEDRRICIDNRKYDLNSYNDWGIHIDSVDMSTIGYMELTYVHQLQQILRLCKIDKEIVL